MSMLPHTGGSAVPRGTPGVIAMLVASIAYACGVLTPIACCYLYLRWQLAVPPRK